MPTQDSMSKCMDCAGVCCSTTNKGCHENVASTSTPFLRARSYLGGDAGGEHVVTLRTEDTNEYLTRALRHTLCDSPDARRGRVWSPLYSRLGPAIPREHSRYESP